MQEVYSVEEARDWFLAHAEGFVGATAGSHTKVCDSFEMAREFFEIKQTQK